ncbi:MAG: hypothetical protein GX173_00465 [Ruminococcaceae bacterium]|nr:hypothetical protein [Oscillospiraceae bacterium]
MDGLEAIEKRIQADAREAAAEILRQSDKTAAEILAEQEATCQQILEQARTQGESQADAIVSRARSLTGLDQRKALLGSRQKLIEQALRRALDLLCAMPADDKARFYRKLIIRAGLSEGMVILAEADLDLGPALLSGGPAGLKLAEKPGSFAGGLVIRQGLIEENLTFETLLKNNHAQWVSLAASVLFGHENHQDTGRASS